MLRRAPTAYLTHVKEVLLTSIDMPLFGGRVFPNLQLLRISVVPEEARVVVGSIEEIQGGGEKLCEVEVRKDVMHVARDLFEGSLLHTVLEKRRAENKMLPFRVRLKLDDVYYHDPFTDWEGVWLPLVVDWEKQELAEECKWPPPQLPELEEL